MPALPYDQIPDFIYTLLNNVSSSALAVVFAILTATRCKPVVTARWADIDFENRTVNIDHQLQRTSDMRYIIETTKTDAGTRVLPITEDVAQMFQAII